MRASLSFLSLAARAIARQQREPGMYQNDNLLSWDLQGRGRGGGGGGAVAEAEDDSFEK